MNKLLTTLTVLTMALSTSAQNLKAGRDLPAVPTIPEDIFPASHASFATVLRLIMRETFKYLSSLISYLNQKKEPD